MSCYDWESGTIVLPSGEWSKFRTALIQEWNRLQNDIYVCAQNTLKAVKAENKGKRGVKWGEVVSTYLMTRYTERKVNDIYSLIVDKDGLKSPKKKDLKILPISQSAKISFGFGVFIGLDNETKSLRYLVRENNHACDAAHCEPMVKKMFSLLNSVKWTRTTGGEICGNDEYNKEGQDEGEGSNYVKIKFRADPSLKKEKF